MSGSFAAVLGPAALRFLRPRRVVGGGGGSYRGLSFCRRDVRVGQVAGNRMESYLLILIIASITTRATAHVRLLVTLFDSTLVKANRQDESSSRQGHQPCL